VGEEHDNDTAIWTNEQNFQIDNFAASTRGVANRGDCNQQTLQTSIRVGKSTSNVECGDAEHNPAVMNSIYTTATLYQLSQNLFDLWQKYIERVRGRSFARHSSFSERGHVKHIFHRCKILWDMLSGLDKDTQPIVYGQ
jgi:hypothetical protein